MFTVTTEKIALTEEEFMAILVCFILLDVNEILGRIFTRECYETLTEELFH